MHAFRQVAVRAKWWNGSGKWTLCHSKMADYRRDWRETPSASERLCLMRAVSRAARKAAWTGYSWLSSRHPEHRNPRCNPFELGKRCVLVDGHVGPRAERSPQISLQHWRARLYRNLFKSHFLPATVSQDNPPAGGTDIADPVHILTEHRHEISLPIDNSHHHWKSEQATRSMPDDLEGYQVIWE